MSRFLLHLHQDSAILRVVPDCATIVDLRFCFLLFRARAKTASLAVDLCPVTALGFRPVWVADFSAARSWPAPDSICPGSLYSFRIGFAIAPAGSVVAAAPDFDLCLNCSAIVIAAAGPDSVRCRFVFDLVSFAAA